MPFMCDCRACGRSEASKYGMNQFSGSATVSAADSVSAAQVACFGTRTTAATEQLVSACMAEGRGARFGSGLTVAQGGCTEPR